MHKDFNELFSSNKLQAELKEEIFKKNKEIEELKEKLSQSNDNIKKLSEMINLQNQKLEKAEQEIAQLKPKESQKIIIKELAYDQQFERIAKANTIEDLQNQLKKKNEEINYLKAENSRILKADQTNKNTLMTSQTALEEIKRLEEYLKECIKSSITQFDIYQMADKQMMAEIMLNSFDKMKKMIEGFLSKIKEIVQSCSLIQNTLSNDSMSRQPTIRQIQVQDYQRPASILSDNIDRSIKSGISEDVTIIKFSDML